MSFMAMQLSMHAWHDFAHIMHTASSGPQSMHMSMQVWHIAMHASSIDIMDAGVMPCIRIIDRIMVLHMSAQFMHAAEQSGMCAEHTVHACSQAEQASIQACITIMSIVSMPGIDIMSFDMASIIVTSIDPPRFRLFGGQEHPPAARVGLRPAVRKTRVASIGC